MDQTTLNSIINFFLIVAGGQVIYHTLFFFIKKRARQEKRFIPELLSKYIYYPGFLFVLSINFWIALSVIQELQDIPHLAAVRHAVLILLAISGGFLIIKVVQVTGEIALHHNAEQEPMDYSVRKAKTKFQLIQQVLNFLIILATVAVVLMTFKSIRDIGTTLLASAGVVGLVIGFAAQKSLGTLFAGLQIALSQPVRIDDIVVVEGQTGSITEITLTYVTIDCWDGRRWIVPISYFLDKPFENWTRVSPEMVGKVKVYTDYTLPVDKVRAQVKSWLEETQLWDKRKWNVLVTGATDNTMEVRASMTAKNSDNAFDLECLIREKLITYISTNFPECLPVTRVNKPQPVDEI